MTDRINYHRFNNKPNSPMSDWGYAMFSDSRERVCNIYGKVEWLYNGDEGVRIETLKKKIIKAWNNDKKLIKEFSYYSEGGEDLEDFVNMGGDEVFQSLNPSDIVNSADGWDSDLGLWCYWRVLKPNNIRAVITNDGAIVFDDSLITRVN